MILQRTRPPLLETPFEVFDRGRVHAQRPVLRALALGRDPRAGRCRQRSGSTVRGHVNRPLSLSLADVLALPRVELAAVNQCSGNSRGLFQPRVAGGQWANGAMGNAQWTGVRLRDVLDRAGVKAGAVAVRFNGLDEPVVDGRAGLHEVARHRPCPRRRGDDRLRDERRAAAAAERLSAAPDRARLVLDLLGQDAERHRGARRAGRPVLDEDRLSHSRHAATPTSSRARPASRRCRSTAWCRAPSSPTSKPARDGRSRRAGRRRAASRLGGDTGVGRWMSRPTRGATWRPATLGTRRGQATASGAGTRQVPLPARGDPHADGPLHQHATASRSRRRRTGTPAASCGTASKSTALVTATEEHARHDRQDPGDWPAAVLGQRFPRWPAPRPSRP